ncbi:OsmC family protein [Novosphingobium sp.]|uniref:OsmC family protein n=1 Tax=Novosphingobium sp. TaxID=1874826 RepID=UPI002616CA34|nr:OsmC family protein [Novosphingobium sp.]
MITVTRIDTAGTPHRITVRGHEFVTDMTPAAGADNEGPDPHEIYDAALGACKALTVLWLAQRKGMALEDIEVVVTRDDSEERNGIYRLRTALMLTGDLSGEEREALLAAAKKCPVHKLMSDVKTEIDTVLVEL